MGSGPEASPAFPVLIYLTSVRRITFNYIRLIFNILTSTTGIRRLTLRISSRNPVCPPPVTCGDSPVGACGSASLRRHLRCLGSLTETSLTLRCGPEGPSHPYPLGTCQTFSVTTRLKKVSASRCMAAAAETVRALTSGSLKRNSLVSAWRPAEASSCSFLLSEQASGHQKSLPRIMENSIR